MTTTLDLTADVIDVRDIIERFEAHMDDFDLDPKLLSENDREEMATLLAILNDIKGLGGDEQWRGDWYPLLLIRDRHFKTYAQELAYDTGMVDPGAPWPLRCIDWDQVAYELKMDYSAIEVDGVTYWTR